MSRLISIYLYMHLFSQRRKKTHIALVLNQSVICHVISNLECHVVFENTKWKWSSGVNFEYKIFNIFFFSDLLSDCEDEQDRDNAPFQPDEEAPPDLNDKPLFSGATITLSVSLLLISSFILRHGLSSLNSYKAQWSNITTAETVKHIMAFSQWNRAPNVEVLSSHSSCICLWLTSWNLYLQVSYQVRNIQVIWLILMKMVQQYSEAWFLTHWPLGDVKKSQEKIYSNANMFSRIWWFSGEINVGWMLRFSSQHWLRLWLVPSGIKP